MEIINLDDFKTIQRVTLDGKEWEVYGITVGDYLDGNFNEKLQEAKTISAKIKILIERLTQITNIPASVLKRQNLKTLSALITIAQGRSIKEDEGGSEKNA